MDPRLKNLNILWVQERNPDILIFFFSQKVPASESPPCSPMGPLEREIHTCRAFYIFLNISLTVFLSEFPVRQSTPCSLTGSPRTGLFRHQSHWPSEGILFTFSFIRHSFIRHSFIQSFMYVCRSPQKGALLHTHRINTVTVHGAPRRRKAYIQCGAAWFRKGIVNDTAIFTPVPYSLQHYTLHLGLGRQEPQ